jgi:hypothetical protein
MADEQVKNSDKNSEPALVPRPDGRGALLTGGKPGNSGGTGRPPDELRALARQGLGVSIPATCKLISIIDQALEPVDDKPASVDSIAFTEKLCKLQDSLKSIGLPTQVEDVSVTVEAGQVLEVMATVLADVAKEMNWPETVIDTIFERYASKAQECKESAK